MQEVSKGNGFYDFTLRSNNVNKAIELMNTKDVDRFIKGVDAFLDAIYKATEKAFFMKIESLRAKKDLKTGVIMQFEEKIIPPGSAVKSLIETTKAEWKARPVESSKTISDGVELMLCISKADAEQQRRRPESIILLSDVAKKLSRIPNRIILSASVREVFYD
jgi:hypothetical protein